MKPGPHAFPHAFPHALLALTTACSSPAPQAEHPGSDSPDTYVEGSRRVWDAARDRGVTFRAVGQEPGWLLEIDSSAMTLITDYGADTLSLQVPRPARDPATRTTVYRAVMQENDVLATIREEPCADTMSGERFSRAVTVVVNGIVLEGCGRQLGGED